MGNDGRIGTFEMSDENIQKIVKSNSTLVAVKNLLKDKILNTLIDQAIEELGNPEEIAQASLQFLNEHREVLESARQALKQLLVTTVVDDFLGDHSQEKASAEELLHSVDVPDRRLREVKDAVKKSIFDELVESVTSEIESESAALLEKNNPLDAEASPDTVKSPDDDPNTTCVRTSTSSDQSASEIAPETPVPIRLSGKSADRGRRLSLHIGEESIEAKIQESTPVCSDAEATETAAGSENVGVIAEDSPRKQEIAQKGISTNGLYVYAVTGPEAAKDVNLNFDQGIDPVFPPRFYRIGSIHAVASPLSVRDFSPPYLQRNLKNPDWERNQKALHLNVLQPLMRAGYTSIPMPFGTVFPSEDILISTLASQQDYLLETLSNFQDKFEWNVQLTCDTERLIEVVRVRCEKIESFIDQMPNLISTAIMHEIDAPFQEEIDMVSESCKRISHNALLKIADQGILRTVDPNNLEAKRWTVLNGVYLVHNDREEKFKETLVNLASKNAHIDLSYTLSEPHPPVSFFD